MSSAAKQPLFRPYLTLSELREIESTESLSSELRKKARLILFKAGEELISPAYTTSPARSLEDKLGMSSSQKPALPEKFAVLEQGYMSGTLSPEEESEYESYIMGSNHPEGG